MSSVQPQTFPASWDSLTKVISGAVLVLLVVTPILALKSFLAAGIALLILFAGYAWSPRKYEIVDRTVLIRRLAGTIRISLDEILEAREATADDLTGCIRLFGSGGLFGWYGLFRTPKLGKATWYVTDRSRAVVLKTQSKTIVISPDDTDGFLRAVHLTVPELPQADHTLDGFGTYSAGNPGAIIGAIVAVIALAIAAMAMLYAPGPPPYTLTPQALTIHDRFYPVTVNASSVDVSGVRIIDLVTDRDWKPTLRTNGFANPHYRAGWFRVAGGQKVRMYCADGKQLVLLPPKDGGNAVLLETRNPERFVKELKVEWGRRSSARLSR